MQHALIPFRTSFRIIKEIPFETETDLRIKGTSRTPDILLSYPIGVKVPIARSDSNAAYKRNDDDAFEWRTICWIDSKVRRFVYI